MYEVRVRSTFSAAHSLREYRGKCENLHGHNWIVEVGAAARKLDRQGMVIDFTVLKKELGTILAELDHTHLNEHPYFRKTNPSSENVARYIFDRMKKRLKVKGASVTRVSVWETEGSVAEYRGA